MPILGVIASSKLGVTSDYESISTVSVGSGGQSTITFSSIPATYTHLQLRYLARSAVSGTEDSVSLRFNGDTGNNYAYHFLFANGSSVNNSAGVSVGRIYPWAIPGSTMTANVFGYNIMDILEYTNLNKYKVTKNLSGYDPNTTGGRIALTSGLWQDTSAISSITISADTGNMVEHSHFALYGIKGA